MSFKTWTSEHLVPNFQRSWAWLCAVAGFVLAVGPDLANLALTNMGMITTVFPEMSLRQKAAILLVANLLTIILRPVKQRNMPPQTIPIMSVTVPDTVEMNPSGIALATEVHHQERIKADPGAMS